MHPFLPQSFLSRRDLLERAGAGFGMLGLASVLASQNELMAATDDAAALPATHFPAKAKRVIMLFMGGGPSQVDTFDPKPALDKYAGQRPAAVDIRTNSKTGGLLPSPLKFHNCGESGIPISESFPLLSQHADELAVVRSLHTDFPNHAPALCMMNLGILSETRPSLGAWTTYGLGSENSDLPGYIVLCPGVPVVGPKLWGASFLPGKYQGTHINPSDMTPEKMIPHLKNAYLASGQQREQLDLVRQINELHLATRTGDDALETRIQAMETAFRMQSAALDAFDVSREPAHIRAAYGGSTFSNQCLLARRLCERGVRFVQLYYGNRQPWDTHSNHNAQHNTLCADIDRPIAALLADLKQNGMLEDTLVIWGGEFGRTPVSEGGNGRDHNPYGFTMWLAGGGVKGGTIHGATDDFGMFAVQDKVHVHDLHATVLHLLGLDHEKLTYRYSGRDFRLTDVHGEVVKSILA